MATIVPKGWRSLKTSSRSKTKQCPKLFYNFSSLHGDGIVLLLTDLISLWRCSLSEANIITSAAEQHTSIDPSESNAQMRVLLDKLAGSLNGGTNKLATETTTDTEAKLLVLKTSIGLPKPLKPLEWTFTLFPQTAPELAEQILRPTLHQLSVSQQKLDSVCNVVKEKDHVIERLLDRVAEKGVDMSLIFPTLTGTAKKSAGGVKVEDARKWVPGMRVFTREVWEQGFEESNGDGEEVRLTELVKGYEKCFVHSKEEHEGWIQRLPDVESLESGAMKSFMSRSQSQSQSQVKGDQGTESENEFETQATPPALMNKRASPTAEEANSSADEGGPPPAKRAKIGKIGALGRRKQEAKRSTRRVQSSPSLPAAQTTSFPNPRKSEVSTATDTASSSSESEYENKSSKQSPPKPPRLGGLDKKKPISPQGSSSPPRPSTGSSKRSTPSRRLGRIGGARQRTATTSPVPEAEQHDEDVRPYEIRESQPVTPSKKVGHLGTRNKLKGASQAAKDPSLPSTRTRGKTSREGEADGVGDKALNENEDRGPNDDSDATASASPSPSPPSNLSKAQARAKSPKSRVKPKATPPNATNDTTTTGHDEDEQATREPDTEDQKANRRREELKRTIQTGGGAKKKRRF